MLWVTLIVRNIWIIKHLKSVHPLEMRDGFSVPSLVYHSLFGNASSLILKLISFSAIGYFFKVFAYRSEGHCVLNEGTTVWRAGDFGTLEDCEGSVARGSWVRHQRPVCQRKTQQRFRRASQGVEARGWDAQLCSAAVAGSSLTAVLACIWIMIMTGGYRAHQSATIPRPVHRRLGRRNAGGVRAAGA